jgi:4-amino-4-deoxy-L-arabinose transferase-like glycosyltransferase
MSVAYLANDRAPMFRVSLILEALRARPVLMFAVAALAQGMLWTLVPSLFYPAPPGDVPLTLAVGKELQLGSPYGPPLAFWLADVAFRLAGIVGVYLLSQFCVVIAFWAVFALGRRIVGAAHATMAILLMGGISVFTVPTLEFGPAVLAMPLTALSLLFCWRALADNRYRDWILLGAALGLLVLTAYAGLILLALIVLFILATARGRSRLRAFGPIAMLLIAVLVNLPHLYWLRGTGFDPLPALKALPGLMVGEKRLMAWTNLLILLVFSHAGLVVLACVAGGLFAGRRALAPAVERLPIDSFARGFVYFFALAPAFVATLLAVLLGRTTPVGGAEPLVVLSGLAVIVAAGDVIRL